MFDKIISHIDPYRGPAQGVGTEHGDTWPDAVKKINEGFQNVVDWIKGFDPSAAPAPSTPPMTEANIGLLIQQAAQPLQDQITSLRIEVEAATAKLAIMEGFLTPPQTSPTAVADAAAEAQLPPAPEPPAS